MHLVGLPEAVLPLTQAASYLSLAPKSNSALRAYAAARRLVREHGALPVPLEVRNAVTQMMRAAKYGQGYRYPHDFRRGVVPEHESYLPQALQASVTAGGVFAPGELGWEAAATAELARAREGGGRPATDESSAPDVDRNDVSLGAEPPTDDE